MRKCSHMPEMSAEGWSNWAQAAAQPGIGPPGFKEHVSVAANYLRGRTILGRPLLEFIADIGAGFTVKQAVRSGVMLAGASTYGAFGAAVIAGAASGAVFAGGKEWYRQSRENWQKPLPPEAVATRQKILERLKDLNPNDWKRLGTVTLRGAMVGAAGGIIGAVVADAFHAVTSAASSGETGAVAVTPGQEDASSIRDEHAYTFLKDTITEPVVIPPSIPESLPGDNMTPTSPSVSMQSPLGTFPKETIMPTLQGDVSVAGPEEIVTAASGQPYTPPDVPYHNDYVQTPAPSTYYPLQVDVPPAVPEAAVPVTPSQEYTSIGTFPKETIMPTLQGDVSVTAPTETITAVPGQPYTPPDAPALTETVPPSSLQATIPPATVIPADYFPQVDVPPVVPEVAVPVTPGETGFIPESPAIPPVDAIAENIQNLKDVSLEAGSNPWKVATELLKQANPDHTPSNAEILKVTKIICEQNNIRVPEWGVPGGVDHRNIPVGFVLKLDPEVKSVITGVAKGGFRF